MNNRDLQIIIKIHSEINIIEQFIYNIDFKSFERDERTKRAVCMTLINIGELVKNLTDEFKLETKHIPWRVIAGMRDITAHKYQTIKMEDVWATMENDIPKLKQQLNELM